jgi:hypothetical protein
MTTYDQTLGFFYSQRDKCNQEASVLAERLLFTEAVTAKTEEGKDTLAIIVRELRRQLQIVQNNATSYTQCAALLVRAFGGIGGFSETGQSVPRQPADEKESTASNQTH